jgi:hypothetical protein
MEFKHTCTIENAPRFAEWLKSRGGIAIWRSIDLSNPGGSWSTPAQTPAGQPQGKPNWQVEKHPHMIITDPAEIGVSIDKEVKRFHVAVRMGGNGLSMKVTDGGSRRIHSEVEKAGEGAYHVFDYDDYKNAVIMAPAEENRSLTEWLEKNSLTKINGG